MGEVAPTLLPPSPRTVQSLSCFKVSQCINCRDYSTVRVNAQRNIVVCDTLLQRAFIRVREVHNQVEVVYEIEKREHKILLRITSYTL